MLRQVTPKNARSKRALEEREPKVIENPKTVLFLRGNSCGPVVQLALADLNNLKRPHSIKFTKKNEIHPFEDVSSLEFFSEKNDASLIVFGHHIKKRPNCLTFIRCFSHKVLDMLELHIDADSFRSLSQFRSDKCAVGLKPLISFSGTAFESPNPNGYTLAKSIFLDFFRGQEASEIDIEGLQYMVHIAAGEETEKQPNPQIHIRVYLIRTKRSGHKLPRVEVEEMGPRIDFRIGRIREADENAMREALKQPKTTEAKPKKNIDTNPIGDKVGRIHMGRQDLNKLQTRKMRGLKRDRAELDDGSTLVEEEIEAEIPSKRERL